MAQPTPRPSGLRESSFCLDFVNVYQLIELVLWVQEPTQLTKIALLPEKPVSANGYVRPQFDVSITCNSPFVPCISADNYKEAKNQHLAETPGEAEDP